MSTMSIDGHLTWSRRPVTSVTSRVGAAYGVRDVPVALIPVVDIWTVGRYLDMSAVTWRTCPPGAAVMSTDMNDGHVHDGADMSADMSREGLGGHDRWVRWTRQRCCGHVRGHRTPSQRQRRWWAPCSTARGPVERRSSWPAAARCEAQARHCPVLLGRRGATGSRAASTTAPCL